MNNGNFEHAMVQTTVIHPSVKQILKWDSTVFDNIGDIVKDKDKTLEFLRFMNDVNSLSEAEAITEGQWRFLYAIFKEIQTTRW